MKTTVDLPDELFVAAKKRAAELREPLRALIERGLRAELARSGSQATGPRRSIDWVTAAGGLPPGVDVSDRAAMHDWLHIDDSLLAAARRQAAERGTTLTAFVERALAASLAKRAASDAPYRPNWKTHRGRTLPGVDVSDRDRLFERMEGRS